MMSLLTIYALIFFKNFKFNIFLMKNKFNNLIKIHSLKQNL